MPEENDVDSICDMTPFELADWVDNLVPDPIGKKIAFTKYLAECNIPISIQEYYEILRRFGVIPGYH